MKIHIVKQWGNRVESVWTSRKKADAHATELAKYSWRVTVETFNTNAPDTGRGETTYCR